MTDQSPAPPRFQGLRVLAVACAVLGIQSLVSAAQLFPEWLAAARQHHYGSMSFTWVALVAGACWLASAYGLWQRGRWARIPFATSIVLSLATVLVITLFGIGDVGGSSGWIAGALFFALILVAAGWLVRYVWRST